MPAADAAYQGAPGAFSEDAARALLGETAALLPCPRFEDVFVAVEEGRARFAVLPVENTLAGTVPAAYELLGTRRLRVQAETVVRVSHALIAAPGTGLDHVREVLSHPVALAQCERFFRRHPRMEPVPVYDTAGAVARVLAEGGADRAAIASARAAAVHGGSVLLQSIEDHPENYTRFLLLADEPAPPRGVGPYKTSVVLVVPHRPGALHECLGHFASRGVDLTRIESRPRKGRPFEYVFDLDLAGHADDLRLGEALDELGRAGIEVRSLGSYPRAS